MLITVPVDSRGTAAGGTGGLHGREREIAALAQVVADARAGRSATLVLCGERGIGKSALLDHLAARESSGARVVRVDGVSGERDLPFAAVQRLCAHFREDLPRLPAGRRRTLETLLGLHTGHAPALLDVGLAVQSLWSAASARRALICLFDDAHRLDEASLASVAIAARRCAGERIAVVLARPGPALGEDLASFPRLTVEPLSEQGAHALLAARLRAPLDARVCERLVDESHGNPRALLSVPDALSPTEMACARPPVDAGGAPRRELLEHAVPAALPAAARRVLLVAAAEPLGDVVTVLQAVRGLGLGSAAVAQAQATGLVQFGSRVRFRHPLARTAVYATASAADRRDAHRALASACDVVRAPEQSAWHLGQSASTFDDAVAAQLHRAADLAASRHDSVTAAALWELSAALTANRRIRALRLLACAGARHRCGNLSQALELLARVHTGALPEPEQARAAVLRARTQYGLHRDAASVAALHEVAAHAGSLHPEQARGPLLEVLAAAVYAGRFRPPEDFARTARAAYAAPGSVLRPHELLLEAVATQTIKGYAAALTPLRRAVGAYLTASPETDLDTSGSWLACQAAVDVWDSAAWQELADRRTAAARRHGVLAALPSGLAQQAIARIHGGRLEEAASLVAEAEEVSRATGATPMRHAELVLAAWSGDEARTTALVAAVTQDAEQRAEGRLLTTAECAQAVLYNALGRYDAALATCATAFALDEPAFRNWLLPEVLESAVRTRHVEEGAAAAERLEECARLTGTDWARGLHLRAKALLAEGPEADALFRESAEKLAASGAVLQAGRTCLLWGEWLRRAGRTAHARVPLRTAYDIFRRAGARAFADRCVGELAAAGARPARDGQAPRAVLTAQEQRIAHRVALGETSKEVAAALFLSPRTVDAHLRSIFRKLDISSRRQLRGVTGLRSGGGD